MSVISSQVQAEQRERERQREQSELLALLLRRRDIYERFCREVGERIGDGRDTFDDSYGVVYRLIRDHWKTESAIMTRMTFLNFAAKVLDRKQEIAKAEVAFNEVAYTVEKEGDYPRLKDRALRRTASNRANRLLRALREAKARDDDPKWQSIDKRLNERITEVNGSCDTDKLWAFADEVERLAKVLGVTTSGVRESDGVSLDSVAVGNTVWLWREHLPLSCLSMVYGDGGCGKSHIAIDWAATVSQGSNWSDGSPCKAGDVIIISLEDDASTVAKRAKAAGANLARITLLNMITTIDDSGKARGKCFSLDDIPNLEKELARRPQTKLVIIDPIVAVMNGADTHRDADVRGKLGPLMATAERYHCCILMVGHTTKQRGVKAQHKAQGNSAFINACRSAFMSAPDPNGSGFVLAHVKSNLARLQPTWGYSVEQVCIKGSDGQSINDASKVQWTGESAVTADEAVAAAEAFNRKESKAAEWLTETLADGQPHPSDDVIRRGQQQGYSRATIQRARQQLKVTVERIGFSGRTNWCLARVDAGGNDAEQGDADDW